MSESKNQPEPARTEELEDLARQIRESHDQCLASFRTAVPHARRAGELLGKAKEKVRQAKKKWQEWVKANCPFELRMAQNYMRIAAHCKEVEEKQGSVDGLTMTQLLALIRKMLDGEGEEPYVGTPEQGGTDDPDAAYRLPEGGYKLKRQELDTGRAEGELTVEDDEKLVHFVQRKLDGIYASIRHQIRKELADLARDSKFDIGHLAIVVIDKIKKQLNAEKLFLAPVEQKLVPEKVESERDEPEPGPVPLPAGHQNGPAEKVGIAG
jgi:hypothetical protein